MHNKEGGNKNIYYNTFCKIIKMFCCPLFVRRFLYYRSSIILSTLLRISLVLYLYHELKHMVFVVDAVLWQRQTSFAPTIYATNTSLCKVDAEVCKLRLGHLWRVALFFLVAIVKVGNGIV